MRNKSLIDLFRDGLSKTMSLHEEAMQGMKASRWKVLDFLAERDGPTKQITIVGVTDVDRSTMSTMLHAMRKDGLVLLEKDPDDGRALLASISAPGREVHKRIARSMANGDAKIEAANRGLRSAINRFLES